MENLVDSVMNSKDPDIPTIKKLRKLHWEQITGQVKSVPQPSGLFSQSLSQFLWHEVTRSIITPPGTGCQSITRVPPSNLSGFPDNLPVPIYTSGWREALPQDTLQCPIQIWNPDLFVQRVSYWATTAPIGTKCNKCKIAKRKVPPINIRVKSSILFHCLQLLTLT